VSACYTLQLYSLRHGSMSGLLKTGVALSPFRQWTPEMAAAHNSRVRGEQTPCHVVAVKTDQSISLSPQVKQNALAGVFGASRRQPNKTELEASRMLACEFPGCEIVFEGLSFSMLNGHRYKPDWIVKMPGGWMLCVEVKARGKNGFRQTSYGRAKLAYDQCQKEWRIFRWRWMEKDSGVWKMKGWGL
jgi:hypothetical protein